MKGEVVSQPPTATGPETPAELVSWVVSSTLASPPDGWRPGQPTPHNRVVPYSRRSLEPGCGWHTRHTRKRSPAAGQPQQPLHSLAFIRGLPSLFFLDIPECGFTSGHTRPGMPESGGQGGGGGDGGGRPRCSGCVCFRACRRPRLDRGDIEPCSHSPRRRLPPSGVYFSALFTRPSLGFWFWISFCNPSSCFPAFMHGMCHNHLGPTSSG